MLICKNHNGPRQLGSMKGALFLGNTITTPNHLIFFDPIYLKSTKRIS